MIALGEASRKERKTIRDMEERILMKKRGFSILAMAVVLVFVSTSAFATVTINWTLTGSTSGSLTCADNSTCSDGTTVDTIPTSGIVSATFSKSPGVLASVTTGTSASPISFMDLNNVTISLAPGETLVIKVSDTGFTNPGGLSLDFGGTMNAATCGGCKVSEAAFFDASDSLFATTTPIGSFGPFGGSSFSQSQNFGGPTAGQTPYSLTEVITLTAGSATCSALSATSGCTQFSGDFQLSQTPEPTSVLLLGSLVGLAAFAFRKKFSGNAA